MDQQHLQKLKRESDLARKKSVKSGWCVYH